MNHMTQIECNYVIFKARLEKVRKRMDHAFGKDLEDIDLPQHSSQSIFSKGEEKGNKNFQND